MIYTLILKPKFKNVVRMFTFLLLVVFSASLYSCQTFYTENCTPEKLETEENVTILEVTTKSDSTINLTDYDVTYFERYEDSSNILLVEKYDTTVMKTEPKKEYKISKKLSEINLKDISYLKIEKSEFSLVKTSILASIILAATVIIGVLAFRAAWKNEFPPFFY